jgi:hypothetical protein
MRGSNGTWLPTTVLFRLRKIQPKSGVAGRAELPTSVRCASNGKGISVSSVGQGEICAAFRRLEVLFLVEHDDLVLTQRERSRERARS